MRRLTAVFAAALLAAGCQDHHQPLGPDPLGQASLGGTEPTGNPHVWVLGRSFTLADGTVCTHVQTDDTDGSVFGVQCGDVFYDWSGVEFNTDLYPVVEICRLDGAGGACLSGAANRAFFVRAPGQIRAQGDKYRLTLNDQAWWGAQGAGTYRVIAGVTFTGLKGEYTPVPGWNAQSDKVLGHYDLERTGSSSNHTVQFRIRKGALCEGGPESDTCVETSFDPATQSTLIFDENYELSEGEGIIGLKFPPAMGEVLQQKINIVIEKIALQSGERCIPKEKFDGSGFTPGRELAPCYNIRTEPYIDLGTLGISDPIQFAMCLDSSVDDSNPGGLLRMLKWSSVKDNLSDLNLWFDPLASFFSCPDDFVVAAAPATMWSRLAANTTRLLRPLRSLVGPQPVHAYFRTVRSPANGSLEDFSRLVVETEESYEAAFLSPVGTAVATGADNLLEITPTVSVHLCLLAGDGCAAPSTGTAPPNWWKGTATWNAAGLSYQANWNTPRNQVAGTYRIMLESLDYMTILPTNVNVTFGTASYTHTPGRTLPLKFYFKRS
jgi:hypothetical protein